MTPTVLIAAFLFCIGLWLTMRGGDGFVDAASTIAQASGVPRFVIGATIVSLATTLPELFVSVLAALRGAGGLAVGNAVGSTACNTGLILGLSALLAPAAVSRREMLTKGGLMLLCAATVGGLTVDGLLGGADALFLLALLLLFLVLNLRSAGRGRAKAEARLRLTGKQKVRTGGAFVLGAAAVLLGARLMVDNGILLARAAGLPESVLGLTLVAAGTSLPELMTALAAIRRREGALSAGNLLGANIIDLTLVLPACTAVTGGLPVAVETPMRDVPATLLLMLLAILPAGLHGRMRRAQGAAMLAVYCADVAVLMW